MTFGSLGFGFSKLLGLTGSGEGGGTSTEGIQAQSGMGPYGCIHIHGHLLSGVQGHSKA
jgi:hypothetical protein